jgi:hypothetical protein
MYHNAVMLFYVLAALYLSPHGHLSDTTHITLTAAASSSDLVPLDDLAFLPTASSDVSKVSNPTLRMKRRPSFTLSQYSFPVDARVPVGSDWSDAVPKTPLGLGCFTTRSYLSNSSPAQEEKKSGEVIRHHETKHKASTSSSAIFTAEA